MTVRKILVSVHDWLHNIMPLVQKICTLVVHYSEKFECSIKDSTQKISK